MATRITSDVLESYLHCKFKGYLKAAGQQGTKCDYEVLHAELRDDVRRKAIDKILNRYSDEQVSRGITLTTAALRGGSEFILDALLEDGPLSLLVDCLKRVEGASELGAFHYIPGLYHQSQQLRKVQKLVLEVYGLLLSGLQGKAPTYGVVWHGRECRPTKVRLTSDHRKVAQLLCEVKELTCAESPPRLVLNSHCQVCEFRERCNAQAVEEDNLSMLLGMQEKEIKAYNRKGFFTVTQISHTFRYRKPRKRAKVHEYPHYYSLQARSIRTGVVHVHGSPSLPGAATRVYLDIEGVPDRDFYYFVGALIEVDQSVTYHSFWADDEPGQEQLFLDLAEFIGSLPSGCPVFHYGSYEATALKKVARRLPPEKREALQAVIGRMVNVLHMIHRHVYFPTYSNTLKEIGKFLGCRWSSPEASGIQSIVWRERWEQTHDPALKEVLMTYNREDCMALKTICDFVALAVTAMPEATGSGANEPSIMRTSDLPKPTRKWPGYGRMNFALGDLERASQCAYFDYQRERVYVRTNKRFKQINRRSKRTHRPVTPNKRVVIECGTCPSCGGKNIKRKNRLRRKTVDLKFFKGGVKKWVVFSRSWAYACETCGARFRPPEWRIDHTLYQPGLVCWCVYQNIECKQNMWQVRDTLADVFGLQVPLRQFYLFKGWIAERYETLYEAIRQAIVGGHLIHIDEATVNLRNDEKGYVWVLTSLDKVYFFYKPSREGTFLNELLAGFQGVLVSDFFSAYESVNCSQQKCLLHLLRDVNDDLQKNPFDQEFKLFAQQFGRLLRRIVETIDRHGLSRRYLARHIADARQFVESVSVDSYSSEVMLGYQKRVKKSGNKLCTFLEHDDVPWNNNNAEHAIKYFAKYRELADGTFSERSLKEALVLLSVFQTCHFNGVNVIKFLLSGKSDLASILGT
jgi:predicted RecB family nuclease